MAAAHDAALRAAGESARQLRLTAIADTMFCADPVAAAAAWKRWGVQMIGCGIWGLESPAPKTEPCAPLTVSQMCSKPVANPCAGGGCRSIEDAITGLPNWGRRRW
jgi:hypothetical protein